MGAEVFHSEQYPAQDLPAGRWLQVAPLALLLALCDAAPSAGRYRDMLTMLQKRCRWCA